MTKRHHLSALAAIFAGTFSAHGAALIHSWDFEGDYLDDIGGADGTVTGSSTVTNSTGFDGGNAAFFTSGGSTSPDNLVTLGGTVNTPISGFSITYWLNLPDDGITAPGAGGDNQRGMFDFSTNGTDSGAQGLYQNNNGGRLNFRIDNGSGTANSVILSDDNVGSLVEDGEWHHIALTMTPGVASDGFQLYLDGSPMNNQHASGGSTTGFTSGDIDSLSPYFGAFNLSATARHGLNGSLDQFQIWDGVLTPAEINALASPIPEPSVSLLGALSALALLRRRRKS